MKKVRECAKSGNGQLELPFGSNLENNISKIICFNKCLEKNSQRSIISKREKIVKMLIQKANHLDW